MVGFRTFSILRIFCWGDIRSLGKEATHLRSPDWSFGTYKPGVVWQHERVSTFQLFQIANVSDIINWAFLDVLPVEFFYLENTMSLFGGYSVYYLGVYGFGSSFTENPDDRFSPHVRTFQQDLRNRASIISGLMSWQGTTGSSPLPGSWGPR